MARSGLTKSQVRTVRDRLLAEGRYPSVDAVRQALGDSGSKSTIHRHLKDLRDEEAVHGGAAPGIRREDTAAALHGIVEQLADRLHAQAEERIRALQAAHDAALRGKDAEIARLQASVAQLTAQLTAQLQAQLKDPADDAWPVPRQVPPGDGFGRFDSALFSTRADNRTASPFHMIRAVARS
jgi:hypothetical protein